MCLCVYVFQYLLQDQHPTSSRRFSYPNPIVFDNQNSLTPKQIMATPKRIFMTMMDLGVTSLLNLSARYAFKRSVAKTVIKTAAKKRKNSSPFVYPKSSEATLMVPIQKINTMGLRPLIISPFKI